jgi:dUTP pyrophosphatase
MQRVKIINTSDLPLPQYQTELSAGMDIPAYIESSVTLKPGDRTLIPTGLFLEIPPGYEMQIRPRSGLALKHGITVLNSPGTIDADYRGEIKVLLINHGREPFVISKGDRIAQMILAKHDVLSWEVTSQLTTSDRGDGGYGSSGK